MMMMIVARTLQTTSSHEASLSVSVGGRTSRFLAAKTPSSSQMTCDKFPRICRAKGSPGSDCCKKKCVDVMTDRSNCWMCGYKCKYPEVCCKGSCVNTSFDRNNCGGCNNKCKKGETCAYGLCNYA
uniref:Stigma-specific STIG1-like protein 1 n=1 Tax=Nelumbo nucifera TaxID=4432 RepID=A0A822XWP7_NELNU|nr:TPA_asm: hypothetical protein HUJ06_024899 [Nelumbo nucifera]